MKRRIAIALALFTPFVFAEEEKKAEETKPAEVTDIKIKIETTKGTIEATMFASKTPMTCANFLNLAKRGYYDGVAFHRVIENFMIQGGDPSETGHGAYGKHPGYKFDNEPHPDLKHDKAGIFSMANSGRNTNGSQFFITHKATPPLDGGYTVFGETTKGVDVVKKIIGKNNTGERGCKHDGKGDKIKKIEILDSTDALFAAQKENLDKWNKILDAKK